jgi:hypothetical protein
MQGSAGRTLAPVAGAVEAVIDGWRAGLDPTSRWQEIGHERR